MYNIKTTYAVFLDLFSNFDNESIKKNVYDLNYVSSIEDVIYALFISNIVLIN
jgi:hypothetical protein